MISVGDEVKVRINFGFGMTVMKILAICGDTVTIYHEPTGIIGQKHRAELIPLKKKLQ